MGKGNNQREKRQKERKAQARRQEAREQIGEQEMTGRRAPAGGSGVFRRHGDGRFLLLAFLRWGRRSKVSGRGRNLPFRPFNR